MVGFGIPSNGLQIYLFRYIGMRKYMVASRYARKPKPKALRKINHITKRYVAPSTLRQASQ